MPKTRNASRVRGAFAANGQGGPGTADGDRSRANGKSEGASLASGGVEMHRRIASAIRREPEGEARARRARKRVRRGAESFLAGRQTWRRQRLTATASGGSRSGAFYCPRGWSAAGAREKPRSERGRLRAPSALLCNLPFESLARFFGAFLPVAEHSPVTVCVGGETHSARLENGAG